MIQRLKAILQRLLQPKVETLMSDKLARLEQKLQAQFSRELAPLKEQLDSQPALRQGWQTGIGPGATYLDFENVFRDPVIIKQRNTRYLPLFKDRAPVLDVGCGRGEFLELLQQAGVAGQGIDHSPAMIALCRSKGVHNVIVAEALTYLAAQPRGALGGIFSCHVIEHLPPAALNSFFSETYRALKPGGLLIVETVNPHNLPAFKFFWLDPTHHHPLFPEYLEWCARAAGFTNVQVQYLTETDFSDKDPVRFGNYAIVAHKEISVAKPQ